MISDFKAIKPKTQQLDGLLNWTETARFCYESHADCSECPFGKMGYEWKGRRDAIYPERIAKEKACQVPVAISTMLHRGIAYKLKRSLK